MYDKTLRLLLDAAEFRVNFPLRDVSDTACFLLLTTFVVLIEHLKGSVRAAKQGVQCGLWARIALVIRDFFIDLFHWPNHADSLCKINLSPYKRMTYLRQLRWDDQLCEQLWSLWMRHSKSANYMSKFTCFEFLLVTATKQTRSISARFFSFSLF